MRGSGLPPDPVQINELFIQVEDKRRRFPLSLFCGQHARLEGIRWAPWKSGVYGMRLLGRLLWVSSRGTGTLSALPW